MLKTGIKADQICNLKIYKAEDLTMSKLDKDQVIAAFTEAYTKANGKAPSIEAKGGWYSVDGAKNVRLADLNDQIAELGESSATEAAKKPANTAAKKTAAKKKAASSKGKNSGFSVKGFWADKIISENTGAKLPR